MSVRAQSRLSKRFAVGFTAVLGLAAAAGHAAPAEARTIVTASVVPASVPTPYSFSRTVPAYYGYLPYDGFSHYGAYLGSGGYRRN